MHRSKWMLALAVVAIALIGYWLWSSRGDQKPESAAPPQPTSNTAESHVELEPNLATNGVDEPRQAARAVSSTPRTPAQANSSSRDFAVRGHVFVRGSRVPIAGADVALCEHGNAAVTEGDGESFARATSDEQGAYEIALPGGAPPKFALRTTHEDFAPAWHGELAGANGDVELDVELDTHFFVGVDVWAPGGRTLVFGADVRLASENPFFAEEWMQNSTDEHGHADFEVTALPRSGLQLIVANDGCAPWLMRGLTLVPGVQRTNLTCTLEERRPVRGRVIDALRKQPIAGAEFEIVVRHEGIADNGGEARSDATGAFEIELEECPAECAVLYARAEGFRAARVEDPGLYSHAGAGELVIELTAPARLSGRVRAIDGRPLTNATIDVAPTGMLVDAVDSADAGANGAFELLLEQVPYGLARVTCQAEGCVSTTLDIIATEGTNALDITLDRALYLHGRVTSAGESRPVPNVRVRLLGANGSNWITSSNGGGWYEFYVAPRDAVSAHLTVELGGRRLATSELPPVRDPLELEHDIEVALVAPSKAR